MGVPAACYLVRLIFRYYLSNNKNTGVVVTEPDCILNSAAGDQNTCHLSSSVRYLEDEGQEWAELDYSLEVR